MIVVVEKGSCGHIAARATKGVMVDGRFVCGGWWRAAYRYLLISISTYHTSDLSFRNYLCRSARPFLARTNWPLPSNYEATHEEQELQQRECRSYEVHFRIQNRARRRIQRRTSSKRDAQTQNQSRINHEGALHRGAKHDARC